MTFSVDMLPEMERSERENVAEIRITRESRPMPFGPASTSRALAIIPNSLFARLISACRSYVILHSPWSLPPSHSSIRHLPWIKMLFFFQACRRGITLRSDREIGGGLKISKNRRQNVETVKFIRIYIYKIEVSCNS